MSALAALFTRITGKVFRARRFHHRSRGPVVINPDRTETVHVWGHTQTESERNDD